MLMASVAVKCASVSVVVSDKRGALSPCSSSYIARLALYVCIVLRPYGPFWRSSVVAVMVLQQGSGPAA